MGCGCRLTITLACSLSLSLSHLSLRLASNAPCTLRTPFVVGLSLFNLSSSGREDDPSLGVGVLLGDVSLSCARLCAAEPRSVILEKGHQLARSTDFKSSSSGQRSHISNIVAYNSTECEALKYDRLRVERAKHWCITGPRTY